MRLIMREEETEKEEKRMRRMVLAFGFWLRELIGRSRFLFFTGSNSNHRSGNHWGKGGYNRGVLIGTMSLTINRMLPPLRQRRTVDTVVAVVVVVVVVFVAILAQVPFWLK